MVQCRVYNKDTKNGKKNSKIMEYHSCYQKLIGDISPDYTIL